MSDEIVAIDGPAGSGKSTVARAVAAQLGWSFLDTGAMYRAVTCEAFARGVDIHDEAAMGALADTLTLTTTPRVSVNGRDVQDEIRSPEVNVGVSTVAANPLVRRAMVSRQREWARAQPLGTVVEGRDITTVVFPDATLKVFLTASAQERARRRGDESAESIARRDEADASRVTSPLRQASDALFFDTTGRSADEVAGEIVRCLKTRSS
ncbi:MAG: (d)CMP kinase [Acidimicrobiales bacterium]|jgi:cytidylate kinase